MFTIRPIAMLNQGDMLSLYKYGLCKGGDSILSLTQKFLDALKVINNVTETQNGASTYLTSTSDCLDLFYRVGALRNADVGEIMKLVNRAYVENPDYTLRILFYARDIRQGLGERRVFRISMKYLGSAYPESIVKNLNLFPEYGRWDDLLVLYPYRDFKGAIINIVKSQLDNDLKSMQADEPVSLLAKWLPSVNASNEQTIRLAKGLSKGLGMSYKEYRQTLSKLRKYIDIIENRLRTKDYTFEYEKQPSKAMLKYTKAFIRNDNERYFKYLESVQNGTKKINTSTIYPYEIVRKVLPTYKSEGALSLEEKNSLNTIWDNLPSVKGQSNSIVVIDGSGSMYGGYGVLKPYQVAISLGLYFAEHSTGAFANHFITFSKTPRLVEVKGKDIFDRVRYVSSFNEVSNTDIQAVFDLILKTAIESHLPQDELPENIYIVSDMEFDVCTYNGTQKCTNFGVAKRKFSDNGYRLPNVIFWNVNSINQQVPVKSHQSGAVLVSGATPKLFDMVQNGKLDPTQLMLDIVNGERYNNIYA